jgi:hypothetical protein
MAKIKLGAIVVAMSGKLGGHVFARNTGGAYMRTKVTPTNPQTTFQSAVRAVFAAISSAWSTLTDPQRNSFRDKVSEYARTDIFGDLKNPTGKALYQRLNQNLSLSGQVQIAVAPNPAQIPSAIFDNALYTVGVTFAASTTGDSTGSKVIIWATPAMSQGTKFVQNKLRLVAVFDGAVDLAINFIAEYEARFEPGIAGDNIFAAIRFINDQGQASPLQIIKASVV